MYVYVGKFDEADDVGRLDLCLSKTVDTCTGHPSTSDQRTSTLPPDASNGSSPLVSSTMPFGLL
jgi:hypothetical protein